MSLISKLRSSNALKNSVSSLAIMSLLAACHNATGEQHAANVYRANQVNQEQDARTIKILAVMPAKIEVDNVKAQQTAQIMGGLLGAVGGALAGNQINNYRKEATVGGAVGGGAIGVAAGTALVDTKILVDGVSITYNDDGKTKNTAQVGKLCEFTAGTAVVITTYNKERRIQPNTTCPQPKQGVKL
jgi:outer membrane lipoprotein SlyB